MGFATNWENPRKSEDVILLTLSIERHTIMATKTIVINSPKTNNVLAIRTCKETGFSVGLRFSLDPNKQNHVKVATAILGSGDKFTHKKGRAIVTDRFDSEQYIVLPYGKFFLAQEVTSENNLDQVFSEIDDLIFSIT